MDPDAEPMTFFMERFPVMLSVVSAVLPDEPILNRFPEPISAPELSTSYVTFPLTVMLPPLSCVPPLYSPVPFTAMLPLTVTSSPPVMRNGDIDVPPLVRDSVPVLFLILYSPASVITAAPFGTVSVSSEMQSPGAMMPPKAGSAAASKMPPAMMLFFPPMPLNPSLQVHISPAGRGPRSCVSFCIYHTCPARNKFF